MTSPGLVRPPTATPICGYRDALLVFGQRPQKTHGWQTLQVFFALPGRMEHAIHFDPVFGRTVVDHVVAHRGGPQSGAMLFHRVTHRRASYEESQPLNANTNPPVGRV